MTKLNPRIALALLLAGAIPFALGGCRQSRSSQTPEVEAAGGSGVVHIEKMGGEIDVDSAPSGATLSTMGGDIHIASVASFAKVKTMGGNISIDQANASIDATTMGGNITIDRANGPIKATTMGGDVTVTLANAPAGDGPTVHDIELTSNGGCIQLTVPKGFPMEIDVTLAYTKAAPRSYKIINDFGLNPSTSSDWDDSHGSPRQYIRAHGQVGNGANRVVIKTINSDVILKQE